MAAAQAAEAAEAAAAAKRAEQDMISKQRGPNPNDSSLIHKKTMLQRYNGIPYM